MPKIEKFLLILLLILLPTQLSYHFWPDWSLINGIRVDYLSPTLYLTDILVGFLFLIHRSRFTVHRAIILFAVLNVVFAANPPIAGYRWLRAYEYYWLYKFLVQNTQYSVFNIQLGLKIALIWTVALAWAQFLLQRSIGGPLYLLGERIFNIATPGIAKIGLTIHNSLPTLIMRPYATLPHPNALAGWLLVAGLLVGSWPLAISLITIPITFSRAVIFLLPALLWRKSKLLTFLLFATGFMLFAGIGNPNSFSQRQTLIVQSLQVIKQHFWFGVGLGNFVYFVPTVRQPVHNIYLLLTSELGIPAFLILSYLVIKSLGRLLRLGDWYLRFAILVVLVTGMGDHYWLTLHQNSLLLVILLAYVYSYQHRRRS